MMNQLQVKTIGNFIGKTVDNRVKTVDSRNFSGKILKFLVFSGQEVDYRRFSNKKKPLTKTENFQLHDDVNPFVCIEVLFVADIASFGYRSIDTLININT